MTGTSAQQGAGNSRLVMIANEINVMRKEGVGNLMALVADVNRLKKADAPRTAVMNLAMDRVDKRDDDRERGVLVANAT